MVVRSGALAISIEAGSPVFYRSAWWDYIERRGDAGELLR